MAETNKTQAEPIETQNHAIVAKTSLKDQHIISDNMSLDHLSLEERFELFARKSNAQSGARIDDSYIGQELIVTAITPYQHEFTDQETGELRTTYYVAFTLEDGDVFKTASNKAIPFAMDIVRFIGVDTKTGLLHNKLKMMIKPKKVEKGFEYNYVATGIVK